jgi:hypothetical protein
MTTPSTERENIRPGIPLVLAGTRTEVANHSRPSIHNFSGNANHTKSFLQICDSEAAIEFESPKSAGSRREIERPDSRTAPNLIDNRHRGHSLASMLEIGVPNGNVDVPAICQRSQHL